VEIRPLPLLKVAQKQLLLFFFVFLLQPLIYARVLSSICLLFVIVMCV